MAFSNGNSSGSANTVSVVKTTPNTVLDDVKTVSYTHLTLPTKRIV